MLRHLAPPYRVCGDIKSAPRQKGDVVLPTWLPLKFRIRLEPPTYNVTPPEMKRDARPPKASSRFEQQISAGARENPKLPQMILAPQPEMHPAQLEEQLQAHPEQREAQRMLARDVTEMVHGADQVTRAERAAGVLFGGSLAEASVDDILLVFDDVPSITLSASALECGVANTEIAVTSGLAASKGEAARLIKQGGLYVNDRRLTDERGTITFADAIGRAVIVLRKGQRERRIVKIQK